MSETSEMAMWAAATRSHTVAPLTSTVSSGSGVRGVVVRLHKVPSLPALPPLLGALYAPPLQGSLSLRATLFDTSNSKFVGSTCVAPAGPLPSQGVAVDLSSAGLVVLTPVPDGRLVLVIELVLGIVHAAPAEPSSASGTQTAAAATTTATTTTEYGVGFAILPLLAVREGVRSAALRAGTPRALATVPMATVKGLPGITSLDWSVVEMDPAAAEHAAHFVPFHDVVCAASVVPGLDLRSLPGLPGFGPTWALEVSGPKVTIPYAFEDLLLARARESYAQDHGVDPRSLAQFSVVERRLSIGVHNTRKFISPPLSVTLDRVDGSPHELVFDGTLNFGLVPYSGPGAPVALVSTIEYVIQRPALVLTKKQRKTAMLDAPPAESVVTVSWVAHVLDEAARSPGTLELELAAGPCHHPESALVYTCNPLPNASTADLEQHHPLRLRITLEAADGAPHAAPAASASSAAAAGPSAGAPSTGKSRRRTSRKRTSRKRTSRKRTSRKPDGGENNDPLLGAAFAVGASSVGTAIKRGRRGERPEVPRPPRAGGSRTRELVSVPVGHVSGANVSEWTPHVLSRADRATLFRAPFEEFVDEAGRRPEDVSTAVHKKASSRSVARSAGDPLNVSTVHVQFLAVTQEPGADVPGRDGAGERTVYFEYAFYTFPASKSDIVGLEPDTEAGAPAVVWQLGDGGMMSNRAGLLSTFTVDPAFGRPDEAAAFARYLAEAALSVTVVDADSHLPVGTARIPLAALLRGGRPAVAFTEKFTLVNYDDIDGGSVPFTAGAIHVCMTNVGSVSSFDGAGAAAVSPHLALSSGGRTGKVEVARVLRTVDAELDTVLKQRTSKSGGELDTRLDAVDKALAAAMGRSVLEARAGTVTDLRTVDMFRERRKRLTLLSKVSGSFTTQHTVYPSWGVPAFFEYELVNPYDEPQVFAIESSDSNLGVITDYEAWRAHKSAARLTTPAERRFLQVAGDAVSIHMDPRETAFIPFRYLVWDEELSETTAKVTFVDGRGRPGAVLDVKVRPVRPVIDATLRFVRAEHEYVKESVPVPRGVDARFLRCSAPDVVCGVRGDGSELYFKASLGAASTRVEFYLVGYPSAHMVRASCVWRVVVDAAHREDMQGLLGQATSKVLAVRGRAGPTQVRVHSSRPATLGARDAGPISLVANALNEVPVVFNPSGPGGKTVQLNVVDVDSGAVVDTWVVVARGAAPSVSKTFQVSLGLGSGARKHIAYRNSSRTTKSYLLRSSDPSAVQLRDGTLTIGPGESGSIGLDFVPHAKIGSASVLIFINDEVTGKNVECLGLDVQYG